MNGGPSKQGGAALPPAPTVDEVRAAVGRALAREKGRTDPCDPLEARVLPVDVQNRAIGYLLQPAILDNEISTSWTVAWQVAVPEEGFYRIHAVVQIDEASATTEALGATYLSQMARDPSGDDVSPSAEASTMILASETAVGTGLAAKVVQIQALAYVRAGFAVVAPLTKIDGTATCRIQGCVLIERLDRHFRDAPVILAVGA